jgi:hypothetical protein
MELNNMATNTYVALRKETVAVAAPSVTFDLTGITGYTDLVIVAKTKNSGVAVNSLELRLNGDTTTNYSVGYIYGDGTDDLSGRLSNRNQGIIGWDSATNFTQTVVNIQNYANATTFKTILCRSSDADGRVAAWVNLWRKTPEAITSITINSQSPANIAVGSTFSLYGIATEGQGYATGGYVTSDADYYYHTFTSSGTFTPTQSITADVLVLAGGGAGAGGYSTNAKGSGGGAGGYISSVGSSGGGGVAISPLSLTTTAYTITVGAGAAGRTGGDGGGLQGSNSSIAGSGLTTITAIGGGGGGTFAGGGTTGGSGGGGAPGSAGNAGTANQGYAGGSSLAYTGDTNAGGGGGGGAGSLGTNASGTNIAGAGGSGLTFSLAGTTLSLAGGGGGGAVVNNGSATSGGGAGGTGNGSGSSATVNTGGGGGGGSSNSGFTSGGSGGSGIVIVRYAKA